MRFKIYTKTNCPGCDALKKRLASAGLIASVEFEMIGEDNVATIKALGARSAPAIVDTKLNELVTESDMIKVLL